MSRIAVLVVLLLLAAPAAGQPSERNTVWTVHTTIEADVVDHYATVKVIADIGNRGPDPEFPFVVQLPDDAYVTGLTITRDGESFEAVIEERETARAIYDEQKAAEQTGGLVEKQRNSQLFAYLVNTAAFDSVQAVLTYEYYLPSERGEYVLDLEAPVSGFGQDLGAAFDVHVRHSDGVQALWGEADGPVSPVYRPDGAHLHHQVGPRQSDASTPFSAHYTVGAAPEGSIQTHVGESVPFVHRFSTPADDDELPLDLVLVLDTSGSMRGAKIAQLQDAGRQLVQALGPEDRLHIVPFSTGTAAPWNGFRSMDADGRAEASGAIDALMAAGSTNIEQALRDGLGAFTPGSDGVPVLVVLTDGRPTVGTEDAASLRAIARTANDVDATVYSIAFGDDADWTLTAGLAEDADGLAVRIEEGAGAEVDLRRFLQALTTPVLRDLHVSYDDGIHAFATQADVVFAGSEVLFIGTFDPSLERVSGTATATAPDGPRTYAFSADVDPDGPEQVARTVAYQRIQALEQAEAAGDNVVEELIDLALTHGFVTDHTSLVVTLPPSELRPFDPTAVPDDFVFEDREGGSGGGSGGAMTSAPSTNTATTTSTASATRTTTSTGTWTTTPAPTAPEPTYEVDRVGGSGPASDSDDRIDGANEAAPTDDANGAPLALWVALAAIALVARRRR